MITMLMETQGDLLGCEWWLLRHGHYKCAFVVRCSPLFWLEFALIWLLIKMWIVTGFYPKEIGMPTGPRGEEIVCH